jgi:hypothetical protein
MPLVGSRLNTQLYADYLAKLQAMFPMPAGLQPAEQVIFSTNQQKLAHSFADLGGTDIVNEVLNAVVAVESVSGVTPGGGSSGPGSGTLT